MKQVAIHTEYITLGQFLKLADCISTGGQAKPFLSEYSISINGEQDQRRGRKLYVGDQLDIENNGKFTVVKG
ncbi:S4 domain-containing protein YaaA [Paenibacillus yanchengensis]|uniref:S4 domain-containing protein YaaA n=1 Tax=Paenibacillus yanchengensis TaxID=2035833 RepID=A0ABW4YPK1_9BACL